MAYQVGVFSGNSLSDLIAFVMDELRDIEQSQYDPVDFVELNVLYKSPAKPREGIIVKADGVKWQPGLPSIAGGGYFGYQGGAWVKLNN